MKPGQEPFNGMSAIETTRLRAALASIARGEVGVTEQPPFSNRGPRVEEYQRATWLEGTGWPYCAAFVCWVVQKAIQQGLLKETATFKRPRTAGAWDLLNWSLAQDNTIRTKRSPGSDILAGDIIIFTFSHCGLAVGSPVSGFFQTVEANTDRAGSREGGGVYAKTRKISEVRSRHRFFL